MTNSRPKASWSRSFRPKLTIALSVGALSVGALSVGALSVGALSVGALSLGALVAGPASALAAPTRVASTSSAFNPLSVTFVSLDTGWALGTVPCGNAHACVALRETVNAGASWSALPLPARLVTAARHGAGALVSDEPFGGGLNVRFANVLNGWIYGGLPNGGPLLWSTHNGGFSWHRVPVAGLASDAPILDLETARGTVYLMAINKGQQRVAVESSPIGQDAWRFDQTPDLFLPAGGGELVGSFVLQGGSGWLVEGNDRGITGSAELQGMDRWTNWAPPCQSVGNSLTVPAASTANNLVAICVMGGFASPLSNSAPPGAKLGSTWLYSSSNGGQSFHANGQLGVLGGPFFGGVLGSPVPNAVVTSRSTGTTNQLVASLNGGRNWSVVFRGNLFYLGFTSPTQGVGLVQSPSNSTSMIMTFDSGHHWSRVNF